MKRESYTEQTYWDAKTRTHRQRPVMVVARRKERDIPKARAVWSAADRVFKVELRDADAKDANVPRLPRSQST